MAARFDALALMVEDDYWCAFIGRRSALPSAIIPNGISFQRLATLAQPAENCQWRTGTKKSKCLLFQT